MSAGPTLAIRCAACNKSLNVDARMGGRKVPCPFCKATVTVPLSPQRAPAAPVPAPSLGFLAYCFTYFSQAKGPWVFGIMAGLTLGGVGSLLKPALGATGLLIGLAGVLGLAVVSYLVFAVARIIDFFVYSNRALPSKPRSAWAALAYTLVLSAVVWLPLVAIDSLTSERGLLAQLVPRTAEVQDRLFPQLKAPSIEAPQTPSTSSADAPSSNNLQTQPESTPKQPESSPQVSSPPTQSDSTGNKAPSAPANVDASAVKVEETIDPTATFRRVTASGEGATVSQALTAAYQSAIEQVVGSYVTAEQVVANNQLIKDQVLSFSRGFVRNFIITEEGGEPGRRTVTIDAFVELKPLEAKLQALQVPVIQPRATSIVQAEYARIQRDNAREMLHARLLDFSPDRYTRLTLVRAPEVRPDTDTVVKLAYRLKVDVDRPAWEAYERQVCALLEQIGLGGSQLKTYRSRVSYTADDAYFFKCVSEALAVEETISYLKSKGRQYGYFVAVNQHHGAMPTPNYFDTKWRTYEIDSIPEKTVTHLVGRTYSIQWLWHDAQGRVLQEHFSNLGSVLNEYGVAKTAFAPRYTLSSVYGEPVQFRTLWLGPYFTYFKSDHSFSPSFEWPTPFSFGFDKDEKDRIAKLTVRVVEDGSPRQ